MSDLQAIAESYERIDSFLGDLRDRCDAAGEADERERVAREQELNDQAYFVLAWGQLETDIDEACRDAIRHAQSHEDWRYRRAWSLYNPDDRRLSGLSFENRVTLVLEKGSGEWKRTIQLYSVRNLSVPASHTTSSNGPVFRLPAPSNSVMPPDAGARNQSFEPATMAAK